jgi:hypothetical protein
VDAFIVLFTMIETQRFIGSSWRERQVCYSQCY